MPEDSGHTPTLSQPWRTKKVAAPEGTAILLSGNLVNCLTLQKSPRHTKRTESNAEQHSGRSHVRHTVADQLVLSHLSMIAIAPQIENAHTVIAVVVVQVVRESRDKCAKSIVRISAFTFQPPNRRLQGCRAGVAS